MLLQSRRTSWLSLVAAAGTYVISVFRQGENERRKGEPRNGQMDQNNLSPLALGSCHTLPKKGTQLSTSVTCKPTATAASRLYSER